MTCLLLILRSSIALEPIYLSIFSSKKKNKQIKRHKKQKQKNNRKKHHRKFLKEASNTTLLLQQILRKKSKYSTVSVLQHHITISIPLLLVIDCVTTNRYYEYTLVLLYTLRTGEVGFGIILCMLARVRCFERYYTNLCRMHIIVCAGNVVWY